MTDQPDNGRAPTPEEVNQTVDQMAAEMERLRNDDPKYFLKLMQEINSAIDDLGKE